MKVVNEVVNQAQDCIEVLSELLAMLKSDEPEPKESEPKKAKKTYSLESVRSELADLSRRGFREDVRALIKKYGAEKLSDVAPSNFAKMMKEAQVIGND